jgi:hypothetical protein
MEQVRVTAYSTEIDSEKLLRLSEEVTRIASSLAKLSIGVGTHPTSAQIQSMGTESAREVSLDTVKWVIAMRRNRGRYLTNDLFADPAWDMLLDLLQAELAQQRVPVSSLCIAAGVPATTALRWINNMVKQGLLVRRPDKVDGRRVFVELASEVSAALHRYFADIVEPSRMAS